MQERTHLEDKTIIMSLLTKSCLLLVLFTPAALGGCPFQNPFWFVEKPIVLPVPDDNGQVMPNRVNIMWGQLENFKCVDYFQVEYFQRLNPQRTVRMSPKINRHKRSYEIEVVPCVEYFFKVIASEDWKGMREDFKMYSEVVAHRLDYTPQFLNPPVVTERRKQEEQLTREQLREQRRREMMRRRQEQQQLYGMASDQGGMEGGDPSLEPPPVEEPEPFTIKVGWRLSDIDYPICLDYFVLDYYDTLYNETGFSRTISRPFRKPQFELEVPSTAVPCEIDFEYILRAVGLNGRATRELWTPPSCVVTTTPATTTTEMSTTVMPTEPEETTEDMSAKMMEIQDENDRLQAKIDGLKQEYEKIGLQVFHAFKESFFRGLEEFLARRKQTTTTDEEEGYLETPTNETQSIFGK